MLELKPTVYKVKLDGGVIELRSPTMRESKDYQDKLNGFKDGDVEATFDAVKKFFETLGFPKDRIDDLEVGQFQQLVEYISGSKKK